MNTTSPEVENKEMSPNKRKLIIGRLLQEIRGLSCVALGPGIPLETVPYLPEEIKWVDLSKTDCSIDSSVDLIAVEALEVSEKGDIAISENTRINAIVAGNS